MPRMFPPGSPVAVVKLVPGVHAVSCSDPEPSEKIRVAPSATYKRGPTSKNMRVELADDPLSPTSGSSDSSRSLNTSTPSDEKKRRRVDSSSSSQSWPAPRSHNRSERARH